MKRVFACIIVVPFVIVLCVIVDYKIRCKRCEHNVISITHGAARTVKPKVSIVIPVYNGEKYLRECLDSIINQTLEDIEIICVNDGSTDTTADILREYEAKDNRIIVINKKNGGSGDARNKGLEIATGRYITFMDSDDYLAPNTYDVAYNTAVKYDADVIASGWRNFANVGYSTKHIPGIALGVFGIHDNTVTSYDNLKKFRKHDHIYTWNKLYKSEILDKVRYIRTTGFDDECFNYCVYPKVNKFVFVPQVLYYHRLHDTNVSWQRGLRATLKQCRSIIIGLYDTIGYYRSHGMKLPDLIYCIFNDSKPYSQKHQSS